MGSSTDLRAQSLDFPLVAANGNSGREKNLHTTQKQKAKNLSDYAQQDLSIVTRRPRILDMQRLREITDSSLLATIINHFKHYY
jgi:hypothetical protein